MSDDQEDEKAQKEGALMQEEQLLDLEDDVENGEHNNDDDDDDTVDEIPAELVEDLLLGDQDDNNFDDGDDDDDDDMSDISEELLETFFEEMEKIPFMTKLRYNEALIRVPELLQSESDIVLFLRYTNYDAKTAAYALCDYWDKRYEIFGQDKAFKPMSLGEGGALSGLEHMIVNNMSTACCILPNDDDGRTVLCCDRTNVNLADLDDQMVLVKYLWYVYHNHLQKIISAQKVGVVVLVINKSTIQLKRSVTRYLWKTGLPIKKINSHVCYSSVLSRILLPTVKFFLPHDERKQIQLHLSIKSPSTLKELKEYGLHAKNLPTSIGGTYKEKPRWMHDCESLIHNNNMEKVKKNNISSYNWRSWR